MSGTKQKSANVCRKSNRYIVKRLLFPLFITLGVVLCVALSGEILMRVISRQGAEICLLIIMPLAASCLVLRVGVKPK